MKKGQTVYFFDGYGKVREGTLIEKVNVLGEMPVDEMGDVGRYKDVNKWEWDVKTNNGTFCVEEKDISLEKIDL